MRASRPRSDLLITGKPLPPPIRAQPLQVRFVPAPGVARLAAGLPDITDMPRQNGPERVEGLVAREPLLLQALESARHGRRVREGDLVLDHRVEQSMDPLTETYNAGWAMVTLNQANPLALVQSQPVLEVGGLFGIVAHHGSYRLTGRARREMARRPVAAPPPAKAQDAGAALIAELWQQAQAAAEARLEQERAALAEARAAL